MAKSFVVLRHECLNSNLSAIFVWTAPPSDIFFNLFLLTFNMLTGRLMDDYMTARNALIAKSFCIEFRAVARGRPQMLLLFFSNGQWPVNMEFVVKYKIAFPIAINTFVWHSAIEIPLFSRIMYAEPRKNLVDTKQRTWQMHVECVRSCHKSRNIDDSTRNNSTRQKSKQKCCLMSSKEVFEIVYEHRAAFFRLPCALEPTTKVGNPLQCIKLRVMKKACQRIA